VLRQIADGLGSARTPLEALNKIDLADAADRARIRAAAARRADQIPLSAATGEGCEDLLAALEARLFAADRLLELDVSLEDGAAIAWLYAHGEICSRNDEGSLARLQVRLSEADAERFFRRRPEGVPARV
jgi:GTP-binding protein HflX